MAISPALSNILYIYVRSKLISSCIYSWSQSIHHAGPEHSEVKKHISWPQNACQHRKVIESYSMSSPHLEILTLKKHPHSVLRPYVKPQKADELSCHRTFTHATQSFWIVFPCCLLGFQILTRKTSPHIHLGQLFLFVLNLLFLLSWWSHIHLFNVHLCPPTKLSLEGEEWWLFLLIVESLHWHRAWNSLGAL